MTLAYFQRARKVSFSEKVSEKRFLTIFENSLQIFVSGTAGSLAHSRMILIVILSAELGFNDFIAVKTLLQIQESRIVGRSDKLVHQEGSKQADLALNLALNALLIRPAFQCRQWSPQYCKCTSF